MLPKDFQQLLIEYFGKTKGEEVYKLTIEHYELLLPIAKKETKGRRKNLENSLYPFVAMYRSIQEVSSKDKAIVNVKDIMEKHTRNTNRKMYLRMGKLPFFFPMFKKMFSAGLRGDSWRVEWVANDKERFEYNITYCLWHAECNRIGCPELCCIFCRNDETNFTDVSSRLHFKRKGALGYGDDCCDFHFYRHE